MLANCEVMIEILNAFSFAHQLLFFMSW